MNKIGHPRQIVDQDQVMSTSVGDTLVASWLTSLPEPELKLSLSVSVPSVLLFPDSRTISKVVEDDDNTNLTGELACAGGSCEVK